MGAGAISLGLAATGLAVALLAGAFLAAAFLAVWGLRVAVRGVSFGVLNSDSTLACGARTRERKGPGLAPPEAHNFPIRLTRVASYRKTKAF